MESEQRGAVCLDCELHDAGSDVSPTEAEAPGYICKHWKPEYWESRGYQRNWGDAAVMNWPHMEILRREEVTATGIEVSFIILAPYALRIGNGMDASHLAEALVGRRAGPK